MRGYLAAIWQCRHFWLALVGMDLRTRYRRSILGIGWSLLQPICMTVVLCMVFQQVFQKDISVYGPQVLAGLAFWNYFLAVTVHSCMCFFHGEAYIRQCPTPLAIYPLRATLGGAVHFLMALIVVIAATWIFNGFGNLAALVSLLPTMVLLLIFGWSMAMLMGLANVYFHDTQHLAEVVCQILFYATPIIYTRDDFGPRMGRVLQFNPIASFLDLLREPILEGKIPGAMTYATAGLTTLAIFCVATFALTRLQQRLIFRL
jgi:ABC-type polysaccharide/polyol phosphate export permease